LELLVSERIKKLRIAAGLSQSALANAIEAHAPYISDLERGVKSPSIGMCAKLADALGCEPEDLFSEKCELVA
jgi:transcriptional regulator with XRE-family HTH domain